MCLELFETKFNCLLSKLSWFSFWLSYIFGTQPSELCFKIGAPIFTRSRRGYGKQSYPQFIEEIDSQTWICDLLLLVEDTCLPLYYHLCDKTEYFMPCRRLHIIKVSFGFMNSICNVSIFKPLDNNKSLFFLEHLKVWWWSWNKDERFMTKSATKLTITAATFTVSWNRMNFWMFLWTHLPINYHGINKYWHYYMDKHMIFSKPFCGQNANF